MLLGRGGSQTGTGYWVWVRASAALGVGTVSEMAGRNAVRLCGES